MKIYTRGGDAGETGLFGGTRVAKTDPRVDAYGTVDEASAVIGLALSLAGIPGRAAERPGARDPRDPERRAGRPAREGERRGEGDALDAERLAAVQEDLFAVGARLAAADPERAARKGIIPPLQPQRVAALEAWIDELDAWLPPLDAFVLPGGSPAGAQLHVARTVCRRAERAIVGLLSEQPDLAETILPYMNRLSDLLFTLARAVNHQAERAERPWRPRRGR